MSPCVLLVALISSCLALPTAEAGLFSWVFGNKSQNNGVFNQADHLIFSNGKIISGSMNHLNYGPVYTVAIQQKKGNTGECEEKITFTLTDTKQEKTIEGKCPTFGTYKTIRNEGNFLLVGNPEESFIAFSTNNELIYLVNDKWKKGAFGNDSTNDKELTSAEIDSVKERISKWKAFFEESDKEISRLRSLKNVERNKFYTERNRLWTLRNKERLTMLQNVSKLRQLKNQERQRHFRELNNIRKQKWTGKLTSDAADKLEEVEEAKYEKNMDDLDKKMDEENDRFDKLEDDIDKQIDDGENKMDDELNKLDQLEDKEYERVRNQVKTNISQGW